MRKFKYRASIILLLILFTSCSRRNEIEEMFIAKPDQYWQYKNDCGTKGIYFKFYKNYSYDKYVRYYDGFSLFNNDGDLMSGKRSWQIKNDTVIRWDGWDFKIISYTPKKIVLSYLNQNNSNCTVILSNFSYKGK